MAYWFVGSLSTKKTAWRQGLRGEIAYRLPLLLGVYFAVRPRYASRLGLGHVAIPHSPAIDVLAVALCALGLTGAIWARRTLAKNWSGTVTLKQNHELVVSGPYHFVRHPIYTSILAMVLGAAIAHGRVGALIGVLLVFASFYIKLKQEEKLMLGQFPADYANYKAHTKAIIPFVL